MYVCICRAVTEQDIKVTVAKGMTTMGQVCKQLGCVSQCGKCIEHVQAVHYSALMENPTTEA